MGTKLSIMLVKPKKEFGNVSTISYLLLKQCYFLRAVEAMEGDVSFEKMTVCAADWHTLNTQTFFCSLPPGHNLSLPLCSAQPIPAEDRPHALAGFPNDPLGSINWQQRKKVNRKVQEEAEAAANPRHQEEEKK